MRAVFCQYAFDSRDKGGLVVNTMASDVLTPPASPGLGAATPAPSSEATSGGTLKVGTRSTLSVSPSAPSHLSSMVSHGSSGSDGGSDSSGGSRATVVQNVPSFASLNGLTNGNARGGGSTNNLLTTANVTQSEVLEQSKKFTVYKVVVNNGNKEWFVLRRYNEFSKLLASLKKHHPDVSLKLPGKRLFGSNFRFDFIESRRQGLDEFIRKLVSDRRFLDDPDVRSFLNIDRVRGDSPPSSPDEGDNASVNTFGSDDKINLGATEKLHARPKDFEFLKVIGKGSFGKVMLARHRTEGNLYAVKVLQKKQIVKSNECKHIMAERNILVENVKHPFLVGLHYSFQTKEKLYFVLDYVNGGELFFHLQRDRCFAEPRARFYAAEITCALSYLHLRGIIYRDLKPENLLLDASGHVVLTDFGLCKEGLLEDDATTNTFCGTPEYLAPEMLRKEAYDKTVDWWCLGAVLYEMLSGLPPFYSRDTLEMYEGILNKPLRFKSTTSAVARKILESLLQKDKHKRLGAHHDGEEVKRHEFFKPINWEALECREVTPPYIPSVKGNMDLRNIDPEFTREPVPASVARSTGMSASVQGADDAFLGFSYAPPTDFDD